MVHLLSKKGAARYMVMVRVGNGPAGTLESASRRPEHCAVPKENRRRDRYEAPK